MRTASQNACEGMLRTSTRSSTARIAHTFFCRVLRIDGVFRRMLMPSEVETARSAWSALVKKKKECLERGGENEWGAVDPLVI